MDVGVNYLSSGNRFNESDADLERDFKLFSENGVRHISMRILWRAIEQTATPGIYNATVLNNHRRVLTMAAKYGIKVNVDFWTNFGNTTVESDGHLWSVPVYVSAVNQIFRDAIIKQAWLNMVEYMMTQLRDFSNIESWTAMNEPWGDARSSSNDYLLIQQTLSEQVSLMKTVDTRPISIRFTRPFTVATGYFDLSIYDIFDHIGINTYLDPFNPTDIRWMDIFQTIADAQNRKKQIWVYEFGDSPADVEHQRQYYEAVLKLFENKGVSRAYAWCWQSYDPLTVTGGYNICNWNTQTPLPAFFELGKYFVANNSSMLLLLGLVGLGLVALGILMS